ncbi:hypothetical protein D3C76_1651890 [compost metagenome]
MLDLTGHVGHVVEQRVAIVAVLHQFDLCAYQRQRCLEFVRRGREKFLLDPVAIFQALEDPIETVHQWHDFGRYAADLQA